MQCVWVKILGANQNKLEAGSQHNRKLRERECSEIVWLIDAQQSLRLTERIPRDSEQKLKCETRRNGFSLAGKWWILDMMTKYYAVIMSQQIDKICL